jgi:hypothetical protein
MKRYSIVGRRYGERGEGVICECDSNPKPLARAAMMQRVFLGLHGRKKLFVDKYSDVRVIDRTDGKS